MHNERNTNGSSLIILEGSFFFSLTVEIKQLDAASSADVS